jgi:hypothetical protein
MSTDSESPSPYPYSPTQKKLYVRGRSAGLDARPIPSDATYPSDKKRAAWLNGYLHGRTKVEVDQQS